MITLKHIKNDQIKFLSRQAKCSEAYVRMILSGDRANRSLKAKTILAEATKINKGIEKAQQKSSKEFLIIGEND